MLNVLLCTTRGLSTLHCMSGVKWSGVEWSGAEWSGVCVCVCVFREVDHCSCNVRVLL